MRERRTYGSERGQGVNCEGSRIVSTGCGGSLTKTREAGGGSLASLAKNSGPSRRSTFTRDPALLTERPGKVVTTSGNRSRRGSR
jgi:hypothetical protein